MDPFMLGAEETLLRRANIDGALAEFAALRAELLTRITTMQTILTLQITVSGAIFSVILAEPSTRLTMVLIIPFTTCLLGLRFVQQHFALRSIGAYIENHLSQRVPGGLGWEQWITNQRPLVRRLGWSGPLVLSFPGVAMAAVMWFTIANVNTRPELWKENLGLFASWVIALLVTIFTIVIVRWSITSTRRRFGPEGAHSP